ncbi:MAG: hypothetical protein JW717_04980, partial [Marinilabiliaceae bacterium]|nr:hypothetical protein [Marinilabiliaceae bacterium]
MKTATKKFAITLTIFILSFYIPQITNSQQFIISANNNLTGDILHSGAGSDFIGVVFSHSGNIYYSQIGYDGTWHDETLLGAGTEAKMSVGNADSIHVVFNSSGKIAYTCFNGTNWSPVVYIESNNGGACSKPDIDVDSNGFSHITYTDTKGNVGDYTDKPDIMYTTNITGSFVKTLIFNGYYELFTGSDKYAVYFDKGSYIALDKNNNYFIITHRYYFQTWLGGSEKQYSVMIKSATGTGSSIIKSSDVHNIYDITSFEDTIVALYRVSTYNTSAVEQTDALINFTNSNTISATSVSNVAIDSLKRVVSGINSTKLFTKLANLEHTYTNITVKGSIVPIVGLDSMFYAIYTDNADGIIKLQVVADPYSLTSFQIENQTKPAIINPYNNSITVEVAAGTNPANLIATFLNTSDVDSVMVGGVKQISGTTPNDYSSLINYQLYSGSILSGIWAVTVTVEPTTYTVSANTAPVEGGSITGSGDYQEGTEVTLTASPNNGYDFINWTENDSIVSTDTEYSFIINNNRNLTANFVQQYTLTINVIGTGSVNVDDAPYTQVITLNSGTTVELDAVAGTEYHFVEWTGDITSTNATETVTMDGNKTITANFAINQYTLTINVIGTGSVNVDD